MTRFEIAYHILNMCEGDNCQCCNWSDEDRETLEGMTTEEAHDIVNSCDYPYDDGLTDMEADAQTLASAGWGTDEDYGYYGEEGH